MITKAHKAEIELNPNKVDYNSRKFKKRLEAVKKECELIEQSKKVNWEKLGIIN